MSENNSNEFISQVAQKEYEYGFTTDVHTETIQKGLSEDVIRLISAKKEERWVRGIPIRKHRRKTNPFRATASSSSVGISTDMPSSSSLHFPESDPFCGRRV